MPRRPRKQRGLTSRETLKKKKDAQGTLIIIGVVVLLLIGGWYFSQKPTPIALDEIGCTKTQAPPELIAIVIDRTDPMNPVQAASVKKHLERIKTNTPRYAEIRTFTVGPVAQTTLPINFRACNPGNPEEIDIWTEPIKRAVKNWKDFNERFKKYLEGVTPSGSESQSPLIESIRSIGATTFSDARFDGTPRKRLIIVSDMLQNSALFSHYRVWLNCKTETIEVEECVEKNPKKGEACTLFGDRRSTSCERSVITKLDFPYWKKRIGSRLNSELKGVEVEVFYVRRTGAAQQGGGAHMTFWEDYFQDNGATLKQLYSLD
jgi:hypothetical protein